jgi:WD40 repeat protein
MAQIIISMDRYVYSLWVPLSLVNGLYSSDTVAARECTGGLPELQEEIARTCKDTWSRIGPSAKKIPGLGGFAHDISLQVCQGECTEKNDLRLKMAIGCGDECIRIADVSCEVCEPLEGWSPRFERKDDSLLWQGISSGVTCLAWHPAVNNVLAFGCKDGSVGLTMCSSSGTVALGTTRHKAPLTRVVWASKHMFETAEGADQSSNAVDHGNDTVDYKLLTLSADGICLEWPVLENIESAFPLAGTRFKAHHQQDVQHKQPHSAGDVLGNPRKVMDGSQLVAIVTTVGKKHLAAIAFIDGRISIAFKDQGRCMIWRDDNELQQGVDVSTSCLLACDVDGSVVVAVHQTRSLLTLYWRPCDYKSMNIKAAAQLHLPALEAATSLAVTTSLNDGMALVAIGFRDGMIQTFRWRWDDDAGIVAGKGRSVHGGPVLTMAWGSQTVKGGKGGAWFLVSGSEDQSVQIHWDIVQIGGGEQLSLVSENKESETELNEAHDVRSTKEAKLPKSQGKSKKGLKLTLGSKALLPPLRARNTSQGQDILQNSISDMIDGFKSSKVLDKDVALKVFLNLGYLDTADPVANLSGAANALKPLQQNTGSAAQSSQTSRPKHSSIDVKKLQAQRAAALELWSGDVGSAIATLLEYDALTADFVSMSASAGRQTWEAVVRVYAAQLEAKGEIHMSVLQLLSVGDVEAACDVYIRSGMVREAATLASARLPPDHPKTVAARSSYISLLESRQEWECVAAHYTGMGQVNRAMTLLSESGTLPSLRGKKQGHAMDSGCRTEELEEKLSTSSRRQYSREILLSIRDAVRIAKVRLGCIPAGLRR